MASGSDSESDSWETASDGGSKNSDSDSTQTASDEGEEVDDSGDLSHLGTAATSVKFQTVQQQSCQQVTESHRLARQILQTCGSHSQEKVSTSDLQEVEESRDRQAGNDTRVFQKTFIQVQQQFGDVTVQGTRNLTIGGTQNIGTPEASQGVKAKQLSWTEKILKRTISRIDSWVDGMVRTSALEKILEMLNKGINWITLTGSPGEGKTTAAYMALRELHCQGRHVFQVTSPEEFFEITATCSNGVIMLDDIFGNLDFDRGEWSRWKPVLHQLLDDKEHRSQEPTTVTSMNDMSIIFIGRGYVLRSSSCEWGRLGDFITQDTHVVDMSHTVKKNIEEKHRIWKAIADPSGIELDDKILDTLCHIPCPHGFPHVCRLFVTMHKKDPNIAAVSFFKTPLEFLIQTLRKLVKDELKLWLFKDMIKYGGIVSVREIGKLDKGLDLIQTANYLVGTYLRKEEDCFLFDHPSIYASVAYILCCLYPLFGIENCSMSFINERLRLVSSFNTKQHNSGRESGLVVYIPKSYGGDLAQRFATEISNRNLLLVLSHEAVQDEEFIIEMMSKVTLSLETVLHLTDAATDETLLPFKRNDESFLFLIGSTNSLELLKYIDNHTDVHLTQSDINTVLHGACKYAASNILTYLSKRRDSLDINVRYGDMKLTPLMVAAETRDSQFVQQIMSLDPDISVHSAFSETALHFMCKYGILSAVEQMIDKGSDINLFGLLQSPLANACKGNHMDIVKLLLRRGARINVLEVEAACTAGNMDILEMLFERGASVNCVSMFGSPLHSACRGGHLNVILWLIGKGASVNEMTDLTISTALNTACVTRNPEVVQCLLEHGAETDNCMYDNTPLHTAAESESETCVDMLLKAGANVNASNDDGQTPLHKAINNRLFHWCLGQIYSSYISVCQKLIEHGAKVNEQDAWGNTPLHLLCRKDISTVIKDNKRNQQPTSFYEDVYRTLVTLLVNHGADVMKHNKKGEPGLRGWCQTLLSTETVIKHKQ